MDGSADRFFRAPEPETPRTPWGNGGVMLDEQQIFAIKEYACVPHWHACVVGPVPLGHSERFHMQLDYMIVPTMEDAYAIVRAAIEAQCTVSGVAYDPEQWDLLHCVLVNGS